MLSDYTINLRWYVLNVLVCKGNTNNRPRNMFTSCLHSSYALNGIENALHCSVLGIFSESKLNYFEEYLKPVTYMKTSTIKLSVRCVGSVPAGH